MAPVTESPEALGDRHLVLVGLMGTGKSTVGPLLAAALGRRFVDLDDAVEASEGRSVRDLLSSGSPEAFRAAEAAALARLLEEPEPLVVATGGGAVLDASSRQRLAAGPKVVWLQAPTDVLVARVAAAGAADRPLLDDGPTEVLARLAGERAPLYAEVAALSVDSSVDDPSGVATCILEALATLHPTADIDPTSSEATDTHEVAR